MISRLPIQQAEAREPADGCLPASPRPRHIGRFGVVVVVAILLVGAVAWSARTSGNPAIAGTTAITVDQLQQDYGVTIDVIGLIASGGLVELRFQVVDADKATTLFGATEDMPMLAVEGSAAVLESARGMRHSLVLLDGASYFFLYTNVGNAVHEGSTVAFVIDDVRVPNLPVLQ